MKKRIAAKLKYLLRQANECRLSWGEIAWLQYHQNTVLHFGDICLMECAAIPEEKAAKFLYRR